MEPKGLEPSTSCLQSRCSSQLSYGPFSPASYHIWYMVGVPGFEPGTSSLSGTRSNQLSYTPLNDRIHSALSASILSCFSISLCRPKTEQYDVKPFPNIAAWHIRRLSRRSLNIPLRAEALFGLLLRKEVIQPQVPLRLPCYDFIPVIDHTLGAFLPCGLDQRFRVQSTPMM